LNFAAGEAAKSAFRANQNGQRSIRDSSYHRTGVRGEANAKK